MCTCVKLVCKCDGSDSLRVFEIVYDVTLPENIRKEASGCPGRFLISSLSALEE